MKIFLLVPVVDWLDTLECQITGTTFASSNPIKDGRIVFSIVIIGGHIFGADWFFYDENPGNSF